MITVGDERTADECAGEITSDLGAGTALRVATAVWRQGESGNDVIGRARAGLEQPAWQPQPAPEWPGSFRG